MLTEREKQVLQLRSERRTFREIGSIIGVSATYAYQIHDEADRTNRFMERFDLCRLGLPRHTSNALLRWGVKSVNELSQLSDADLLAVRNLGKGGLRSIRALVPIPDGYAAQIGWCD